MLDGSQSLMLIVRCLSPGYRWLQPWSTTWVSTMDLETKVLTPLAMLSMGWDKKVLDGPVL